MDGVWRQWTLLTSYCAAYKIHKIVLQKHWSQSLMAQRAQIFTKIASEMVEAGCERTGTHAVLGEDKVARRIPKKKKTLKNQGKGVKGGSFLKQWTVFLVIRWCHRGLRLA